MKRELFISLFLSMLLFPVIMFGQLVVTQPTEPMPDEAVVITFDATLGSGGLAGYTGDVYAHTGINNWEHVQSDWGENVAKTKLERIGTDLYELHITPTIRQYYEAAADESIWRICLVFRSAEQVNGQWLEGKTADFGDIFIDVISLRVMFNQPEHDIIVTNGQEITIEVQAIESTEISLLLDNVEIASTSEAVLNHSITANSEGLHWLKAIATDGTDFSYDSIFYFVRNEIVTENLPVGVIDGINYIDDNSITLVLHAPFKDNVFVIGSFNEWLPNNDFLMNRTPDNERYWLTINNLQAGVEYQFQYLVDGDIRIADPYSDKISDPWNDQYIPSSTYPNLITYPHQFTTQPVSCIKTAQQAYSWNTPNFTAPPIEELVIYELHIRDFVETRAIKTITDSLDYLQSLGINAIELMPINEFEGNDSWGYNPSFYFAPDKAYGTENDYKVFIDECHSRGMAVIIDMVLNHSYGQSPLVRLYFDPEAGEWGQPSAENPWYNQTCPHSNWCWGYDFNHESLATQAFIDRVNTYWIHEFKVDGFRFDFTKGFTNNTDPNAWNYDESRVQILKRMADAIWTANENAYVILEHLTDNSEEKVLAEYGIMLWGNMNHNYTEGSMGWVEDNKSDLSWASYKQRNWGVPHLIAYMESHDEERMMFKNITWGRQTDNYDVRSIPTALSRVELAATFFFTIPGPKMIWQFGELGYDVSIDEPCRVCPKPLHWEYWENSYRQRLYKVFSALIELKKDHEVFNTANFSMAVQGAQKRINLNGDEMNVTVIGNFDVTSAEVSPNFQTTGQWYDYFSGESITVSDISANITLAPGEYHIYTDVQLETPNITSVFSPFSINEANCTVYPNPSDGNFNFIISLTQPENVSLEVFDLNGRRVANIFENNLQAGIYEIFWNGKSNGGNAVESGCYYYVLKTQNAMKSGKLIVAK